MKQQNIVGTFGLKKMFLQENLCASGMATCARRLVECAPCVERISHEFQIGTG